MFVRLVSYSKMAASGVSVRDEVVAEYNNIKIGHKYSYIQLKLTDDKTAIEVEKAVPSEKRSPADEKKAFEDFVQELPPSDCRYVVYDFHFETTHSGSREQLIFVVWCPDKAPTKSKMLYASSKEALRKKLVGITHEVQATDMCELNHKEITEKVLSRMVK